MSAKRDLAQAKLAPCRRNIFACVQAGPGSLIMNVLPGSSGNVLLRPLAAGITFMSRYSCLELWYVALPFIDFFHLLSGGVSSGCPKRAGEERR